MVMVRESGQAGVLLQKDEALEKVARMFWRKLEHSDPGDGPWDDLSEETKGLYRNALKFALDASRGELLSAYFGYLPRRSVQAL